jgi:hypothetical protein
MTYTESQIRQAYLQGQDIMRSYIAQNLECSENFKMPAAKRSAYEECRNLALQTQSVELPKYIKFAP